MSTVLDLITGAEADSASADTAAAAAIAADKAAADAKAKADGSKATEAVALHSVGEVYVAGPDGSITTYDSPDGVNVQIGKPKNAASITLPDPTPPPVDPNAPPVA